MLLFNKVTEYPFCSFICVNNTVYRIKLYILTCILWTLIPHIPSEPVYCIRFNTVYSLHYTVYSLQYTVYSLQYTVYSLHYTVYSIQYYTVYCIFYLVSLDPDSSSTLRAWEIKSNALR